MWGYAQRDVSLRNIGWRPLLKMTWNDSSIIPFLVPRRKVWLTPTARVPCSNAANIGERRTWTQSEFCTWQNSVRGQDPQKFNYTVPTQETAKHRASCKVWLTSVKRRRCSNEAKTRKPLKFAWVPQTRQSNSAVCGPKFTIL